MGKAHDAPMWHRLFALDPKAPTSLQAQLRQSLVKAILDGHIPVGEPLPSSRELSRQLGIARNTVVLAYQHLIDENYLLALERRGYFVNPDMLQGRVTPPRRPNNSRAEKLDCNSPPTVIDPLSQRNIVRPLDWQGYEFPFIYGQVDPSLFPVNDWREACRLSLRVGAISEWTHDRIDHDDELLTEQILSRVLPRRGVWASKEELLITTGAQNALYLIAQLLLNADTAVGMEDPCYADARNIFSLFTNRQHYFPVGAHGVQTNERLADCRFVYVTPSHQCPTTATMPLDARRTLLDDAERHDVMVVEDDYESELNFIGQPTPALKSLDENHRVIYVGSLSKTLAPGLRIGFMVGPPSFIRQARALRRLMYRHPPTNTQRTVGHFLALGHHDSALLRLTQAFQSRWRTMDDALAQHEPLSAVAPGFGGSSFWVRLPEHVRAAELERRAAEKGVLINAGDSYFAEPGGNGHYCRMGFSSIPEDRIVAGIQHLAHLVSNL